MANPKRNKLLRVIWRGGLGGYTYPPEELKGLTPEQHCQEQINQRKKGKFEKVSEGEDVCLLPTGGYFVEERDKLLPVWSYQYEVIEDILLSTEVISVTPPEKNRTTIIMGEKIKIISDIPVYWEVSSDLVTPGQIKTTSTSKSITLTALDKAGAVTITARTEHKQKSITIKIIEPKIILSSETAAILPANRNRTTIGVGEKISIFSNIPVLWEVPSDLVTPRQIKTTVPSKSITFTALDKAGSVSVKAKLGSAQKSITIRIITPSSLKFEILSKIHTQDVLDSGFIAKVYVLPDTVNFGALYFAELESYATATGLLVEGHNQPHGKYEGGHSEWVHAVANKFEKGKGTDTGMQDTVYGGQNEYEIPLPFTNGGKSIFKIEYIWSLDSQKVNKLTKVVNQSTTITKDGYITTQKNDQKVAFYYKDKSINSHLTPGGKIPIPKPINKKSK
ncbi:hypothetical protein [Stenoxybacter acetivorans]|uniref:hypothetical protein n=1 Tax=Stenoxybacter acetivorans TaxID=422441 RepID=UPI000561DE64|nr:hypothetical protein [Stenoxybacter acetivorans]